MIRHNLRYYAYVILGLAFLTFSIVFVIRHGLANIDLKLILKDISYTITINLVLWLGFVNWAWKWRIFYWLVQKPNLSGYWKGNIETTYKGQDKKIPTEIWITQSFFHIQIKLKTGESTSYSQTASFDMDKDRGLSQLYYSYLNTPKTQVREHSEIHYGTTRLTFNGFAVKSMEGEYWTSRKSTGDMTLTHIKAKKRKWWKFF